MGDECLGLLTGECRQRARDDKRHTGQRGALLLAGPLHVHAVARKAVQQVGCAVLCKKLQHALGHDFAEAVDLAHLLGSGLAQGVHAAEMLTQQRGGLVADVADAKAENQLVKIVALRAFDCVQKVLCALFLEFVQRKQLLLGQGVQVSYRGDQPLVDELYGHSLAQAVNGHGVAGRKVDEVAQALRRAFGVDAAQGCFVLQMHHGCAAARAGRGHGKGLAARQTGRYADDLRDDVPRLAHLDGVPDADA